MDPLKPIPSSVWRLATTGMELTASVVGGTLLGYWVDRRFGTEHWGLLIGAGIGIVGGLYNLVRRAVHESVRMTGRKASGARQGGARQDGRGERQGGAPPDDAPQDRPPQAGGV